LTRCRCGSSRLGPWSPSRRFEKRLWMKAAENVGVGPSPQPPLPRYSVRRLIQSRRTLLSLGKPLKAGRFLRTVRHSRDHMKAKSKRPTKQVSERRVRMRILCVSPPIPEDYGAAFGLQDNSTTKEWVIHAGEGQSNGDVHFECECRVRRGPVSGKPNFLGQFVHGGTSDRFLYLSRRPKDWHPGGPEVQRWVCLRRMKIRLGSITWPQIQQVIRNNGVWR
jgi:hypothetical protein